MQAFSTFGLLITLTLLASGCAQRSDGVLAGLGSGMRHVGRNIVNEGPNSDFRYGDPHKPATEADLAAERDR